MERMVIVELSRKVALFKPSGGNLVTAENLFFRVMVSDDFVGKIPCYL